VKISGGDYGWMINSTKEVQELIKVIKEGQVTTKEPIYMQTASARDVNDLGKTYVEVDMTKQHLWFYKNGSLVVDGDVVTGNVSDKNATPTGVYKLKYKQKNATLRGDNYNTPVSFWMPFNGDIGIHDATWRDTFGGNIYMTNGSHGCVNAPYTVAKTIFSNIDQDTPVICYFE
jgi:lipoprotein-anchoring transpeptidase ErfK/SrfK